MSKEIHFVVKYLVEHDEFEMDYETQDVKFYPDGPVWNTETQDWENIGEELFDDESDYCKSSDVLADAIRDLKVGSNNV